MAISTREPKKRVVAPVANEKPLADESSKAKFSASKLATIEDDIRHSDLTRVIRRQAICTARPAMPVQRVFDEVYIHIPHLRQMIKSNVDFFSNRWLFKYLTQILDERMLTLLLNRPDEYLDKAISLNLNVETLLTSHFNELDATLKPEVKSSIVIEIPIVDVFADIKGFMAAKDEVQSRGYRVCLDGLTAQTLMNIDRSQLGVDLIKLQWNADTATDLASDRNKRLIEAVKSAGTNRVILGRCDNEHAVAFGQALGVSLFQGRYLDGILDPDAKVTN